MLKNLLIILLVLLTNNIFSQTQEEMIIELVTQLEETTVILEQLVEENERLTQENIELKEALENSPVIEPIDNSEYIETIEDLISRLEESNETIISLQNQIEEDQVEITGLRDSINELVPLVNTSRFSFGGGYIYPHGIHIIGSLNFGNIPFDIYSHFGLLLQQQNLFGGIGILFEF